MNVLINIELTKGEAKTLLQQMRINHLLAVKREMENLKDRPLSLKYKELGLSFKNIADKLENQGVKI